MMMAEPQTLVRTRKANGVEMGLVGGKLSPELQRKIAERWHGMVYVPRASRA